MKGSRLSHVLLSGMLVLTMAPATVAPVLAQDDSTPTVKEGIANVTFIFKNGTEKVGEASLQLPLGTQNYSILKQYVPEGYEMTVSGDFSVTGDGNIEIAVEKKATTGIMNVRFMDGNTFVAGGDYTLPLGTQNYSILKQYVPEGYEMTVSGDFTVTDGDKIEVAVEKKATTGIMNVRFMDGDTFVAGGDYTLPLGTQNYSILKQYVPEGYEMTVSGDFAVTDGGKIEVSVEKTQKDVVMNILFKDEEGNVVAGGDYFVPEGVNKYTVLSKYVPEGYEMTDAGDFSAAEGNHLIVNVKKSEKEIIMNIAFKDGDTFVAGGDYFLPEGVNNYSVLEKYVPEGYEMTVAGDFYAEEGGYLIVSIAKKDTNCIMNIRFMDGDTFVAGGDYTVLAGVNNYSVLEQYVPEGYEMEVSGDFMAFDGAKLEVSIRKIQKDVIMNVRFMDGDTFLAGGDYFLPEGVNNYTILEQYVPEGYVMSVSGDFMVTDGGHIDVPVEKVQTNVIMNIRFMYGDEFIAGGDYFVPAGVNNYSILEQYVPEGYKMAVAGDFFAEDGGKLVVDLEKINDEEEVEEKEATLIVKVVDFATKDELSTKTYTSSTKGSADDKYTFVAGTDWNLEIPEGYALAKGFEEPGNVEVAYGDVTTVMVYVTAEGTGETDPSNPGSDTGDTEETKPGESVDNSSKDEQNGTGTTETTDEKKDSDKVDTGVRNGVAGFAVTSIVCGAAIVAVLKKKRELND